MKRRSPSARFIGSSNSNSARPLSGSFRPRFEHLEDRRLLTGNVYINEIYWDPPAGGDAVYEYIELRGTPGMSLANMYLIFLEDENTAPAGNVGNIDNIFNLGSQSIGSNGFLTIRQKNATSNQYTVAAGTTNLVNSGSGSGFGSVGGSSIGASDQNNDGEIENGGFTCFLVDTGGVNLPTIGFDLDAGNNGLDNPNGRTGWTILDGIGIFAEAGEAAGGRLYAQINFGIGTTPGTSLEPGATYINVPFEIEYAGRWGNSIGQTSADWLVSNLTDETPATSFTGHGDFRQSAEPKTPEGVVEANKPVLFDTIITGTLGSQNIGPVNSTVAGRFLFYKDSFPFDDADAIPGGAASHDQAIATNKVALLPGGGQSTFANTSSYNLGINGIMVDLSTGGTHGSINASDFTFRVSGAEANNDPNGTDAGPVWATVAATPTISVRPGAGVGGSDRVEITWANGAIKNTWLEVTVKANSTHTGLAADSIFYFGNLVGNSGNGDDVDVAFTDSTDVIGARANQVSDIWDYDPGNTAGLTTAMANPYDYNRDNNVDATDIIIARANGAELLHIMIDNPPHAPATGGGGDAGVASALSTLASSSSNSSAPVVPGWLVVRLETATAGEDSSAADILYQALASSIAADDDDEVGAEEGEGSPLDEILADW